MIMKAVATLKTGDKTMNNSRALAYAARIGQDVCDMFDTTNMTIAQVARHFHLTVEEVKSILLEKADD
jgi:hypothetical protein